MSTESFQGVHKISQALALLGISDPFRRIASGAKMNDEGLRRDLEQYTGRRHKIVHQGDYDLEQQPPTENKITKQYAADCIKLIVVVAHQIERLPR